MTYGVRLRNIQLDLWPHAARGQHYRRVVVGLVRRLSDILIPARSLPRSALAEWHSLNFPERQLARQPPVEGVLALRAYDPEVLAPHLHCTHSANPHRCLPNELPGASLRLLARIRGLTWINVTRRGSGLHEFWFAAPFARLTRKGGDNDVCSSGGIWDRDLRCDRGVNAAVLSGASPRGQPKSRSVASLTERISPFWSITTMASTAVSTIARYRESARPPPFSRCRLGVVELSCGILSFGSRE